MAESPGLIHRSGSTVYQEIQTPSTAIGALHEFSGPPIPPSDIGTLKRVNP